MMRSNLKEINKQYEDACRYYLERDWKPCPRCKCKPVLGLHIEDPIPWKKDDLHIYSHLTLTCKCDTYHYATMNPSLLGTQWTNHCYIVRATEKGITEVNE